MDQVDGAASEADAFFIEARELLAQLASDGLEVCVDFLGIKDAIHFRVKIPTATTVANPEKGE